MPQEKKVRRKVRLIKPGLQLKLTMVFLCVGVTCILVQFTLLSGTLSEVSEQSPATARMLYSSLWKHLATTLALLVPLTLSVGILVTHRVAGPAYRFEQYLKSVAHEGTLPGPCRIRKGDELQELCDAVNAAVDRFRVMASESSQDTPAAPQTTTETPPETETAAVNDTSGDGGTSPESETVETS